MDLIHYSVGGTSGGTVYEFRIHDWQYGVVGKPMGGPGEVSRYADPPSYGGIDPAWEDVPIPAVVGDTIELSYRMDGYAYTQDDLTTPSHIERDGDYPLMHLSVALWIVQLPDLVGEFTAVDYSIPSTPGASLQADVEVTTTNIGQTATEAGQGMDMAFFLRPSDALDASEDILVWTQYGISVGKLAPGHSVRVPVTFPLTLPVDIGDRTYVLVAYVDSSNDVFELREDNNEAIAAEQSPIGPFFGPDLTGQLIEISFRGSLGPGTRIQIGMNVNNVGNMPTESKQTIDIEFCLRPFDATDSARDTSLFILPDQSVSGLGPGSSKTFRTQFKFPAGIAAGSYRFVAKVDSSNRVAELNENNNEASSEVYEVPRTQ